MAEVCFCFEYFSLLNEIFLILEKHFVLFKNMFIKLIKR